MPQFDVTTSIEQIGLLGASSMTLTNVAGSTLYYDFQRNVTSSVSAGSLTAGQSLTFTQPFWIVSAYRTTVQTAYATTQDSSSDGTGLPASAVNDSRLIGATTGQAPVKQSDGGWAPGTVSGSLAGLTDAQINTPTDGQTIAYNASLSAWVNKPPSGQTESGPGQVADAATGTTLTVPDPTGSSGFTLYRGKLAPASGSQVSVVLSASSASTAFYRLRLRQDAAGGIGISFPGAIGGGGAPVKFVGPGGVDANGNYLGAKTQAYDENFWDVIWSKDASGTGTYYLFPGTSSIVNVLLRTCKAVFTTNQALNAGLPTMSGVTFNSGDRVLLVGQTTASQNGTYTITASGTWPRTSDLPSGAVVTAAVVPISSLDTANPKSLWALDSQVSVTIDTSSLTFDLISGAQLGSSTPLADGTTPTAGNGTTAAPINHVHPRKLWTPDDHGLISWAFDPAVAGASLGPLTAGTVYGSRVHLPLVATITNILFYITTPGTALVQNQCYAGLYYPNGNKIGGTPDLSGQAYTVTTDGTTATVVGSGTAFVGSMVGAQYTITGVTGTFTVQSVTDATHLVLTTIPATAVTSQPMTPTATYSLASSGVKQIPLLGGPYAVPAGDVTVVVFSNGTTQPKWAGGAGIALVNQGLSNTNSRFFSANTAQTTALPAALSGVSASSNSIWAAVS